MSGVSEEVLLADRWKDFWENFMKKVTPKRVLKDGRVLSGMIQGKRTGL